MRTVVLLAALAAGCSEDSEDSRSEGSESPESQGTGPDSTGMTTVQRVSYGMSVEDALALLEETGVEGVAPEVNFPHYATGTKPPAGTSVPLGSTVKITIGDG